MGLDMYLAAEFYIGGWKRSSEEERGRYMRALEAAGLTTADAAEHSPSVHLRATIAYWRKANAVHAWFVRECGNGIDECQDIYVDRDKLTELRDLCKSAKETQDTALLPTQAGFFFGSTEFDECYWQDIEDTANMLAAILDNPRFKEASFYYRASW